MTAYDFLKRMENINKISHDDLWNIITHHGLFVFKIWSGRWESNPPLKLGKLAFYR